MTRKAELSALLADVVGAAEKAMRQLDVCQCLHSPEVHDIRNGRRTACSVTSYGGTRCPCKTYIPRWPDDPAA